MKQLLYVLFSICALQMNAQEGTVCELNNRNGFQNIKINANIPPSLTVTKLKTETDSFKDFYSVTGKKYFIGNIEIITLHIYTFKNTKKVSEILIEIPSNSDILNALKELYGEPTRVLHHSDGATQYCWNGIVIMLNYLITAGTDNYLLQYYTEQGVRRGVQLLKAFEGSEAIKADYSYLKKDL